MHFSVGILYSSIDLLELVADVGGAAETFTAVFTKFRVASAEYVLNLCVETGWLRLDRSGGLRLSQSGRRILAASSIENSLRICLSDMIRTYRPTWLGVLSRGRKEARSFLPRDVFQCIFEAGLFGEVSEKVVDWWDQAARLARTESGVRRLETGRRGEMLSLDHERSRTNSEPVWQAVESDLSGFDVLSIVSDTDTRLLRIEVKASNSILAGATFHLSRRQWDVARTSENYVFHLWALRPKPALQVVVLDNMAEHVAQNKGLGKWEAVEIPFSAVIE